MHHQIYIGLKVINLRWLIWVDSSNGEAKNYKYSYLLVVYLLKLIYNRFGNKFIRDLKLFRQGQFLLKTVVQKVEVRRSGKGKDPMTVSCYLLVWECAACTALCAPPCGRATNPGPSQISQAGRHWAKSGDEELGTTKKPSDLIINMYRSYA